MINTILFDLDGTLLPMNPDKFMYLYFKELGKHFKEYIDPEKITEVIMDCTTVMIKNIEPILNQDIFMKRFKEIVGGNKDFYLSEFHKFYDGSFKAVQESTWQNENIINSVRLLKEKGYKVVIATNPLFPMKANHHRIRWAGLDPEDFEYISSFENNQYCKPNLEFYQEVLSNINKQPSECMMVGNDVLEDLVSAKLGLKTFLIDECIINTHNLDINANHVGNYNDFYNLVKELKSL